MKHTLANKCTKHLRFALHQAGYLASKLGQSEIEPAHMLLGCVRTHGALAAELLANSKFSPDLLEASLQGIDPLEIATSTPHLSILSQQCLLAATALAYRSHHPYVGTEHLLSSIIEKPGPLLEDYMRRAPWSSSSLKQQLEMIFKSASKLNELTETFVDENDDHVPLTLDELPPATRGFGVHLTNPEHAASLDPVIGPKNEINLII